MELRPIKNWWSNATLYGAAICLVLLVSSWLSDKQELRSLRTKNEALATELESIQAQASRERLRLTGLADLYNSTSYRIPLLIKGATTNSESKTVIQPHQAISIAMPGTSPIVVEFPNGEGALKQYALHGLLIFDRKRNAEDERCVPRWKFDTPSGSGAIDLYRRLEMKE